MGANNKGKRAKPPAVELPGQHGLQKRPPVQNAATRLRRLLKLSGDVPLTTLLREAGDEIVELRQATTVKPADTEG